MLTSELEAIFPIKMTYTLAEPEDPAQRYGFHYKQKPQCRCEQRQNGS